MFVLFQTDCFVSWGLLGDGWVLPIGCWLIRVEYFDIDTEWRLLFRSLGPERVRELLAVWLRSPTPSRSRLLLRDMTVCTARTVWTEPNRTELLSGSCPEQIRVRSAQSRLQQRGLCSCVFVWMDRPAGPRRRILPLLVLLLCGSGAPGHAERVSEHTRCEGIVVVRIIQCQQVNALMTSKADSKADS